MTDGFFAVKDLAPATHSPGVARRAALAGRAMMTFFTFAPGSEVPIHEHPHDQLSVVIRGKAAFTVEGEARILGPGEGVRLPGGVRHGVRIMDEETEIWDVWAPPREEYLLCFDSHRATSNERPATSGVVTR